MTASLWDAQFEYWINKLSEPGFVLRQTDGEDIKNLFTDAEWQEARYRGAELEAEMAEELEGRGQQVPSELSGTMESLIYNIRYTASIHLPISQKHLAKANEHQHWINKAVVEAVEFYETMPPDEKRFWEVEYDENGDWNYYPRQVDKWSALRPDLVSPKARALIEALERKRQS